MSRFELINSLKVNDEIPVKKYLSKDTGIQVYVAEVQSPLTNAYLALGKFLPKICNVNKERNLISHPINSD